jgi:adenosylhomocysteine nucleosidase
MGEVVVIISANTEWRVLQEIMTGIEMRESPIGQWFEHELDKGGVLKTIIFFHGGWGKISAAASAQYVIDRWSPSLIVNLGTCGGFEGLIEKGAIILVDRTVVYDIIEQMGDSEGAIRHYTTELDLSWLGSECPHPVHRDLLVSGDRDLLVDEVPKLAEMYGARAGDWESGAIAWVCARNGTRCLILRGVTDHVGAGGGEAYDDNFEVYVQGTREVLGKLVSQLPDWIATSINS